MEQLVKIKPRGQQTHTGIVNYGDTVTVKAETRNLVGETLEFEVWEDKKQDNHTDGYSTYDTWDDEKLPETVQIKIDDEGNGETNFTVPCDWENKHSKDKEGQPRYFYLKEKESGEEFPRAYYVKNPNKTEEENKKNSQRIGALMLKVAKSLERDKAKERESAVVLGEELPPAMKEESKNQEVPWMVFAKKEYETYKNVIEKNSPLKERISEYFNSSYAKGAKYDRPWCAVFVNWCFEQTEDYKGTNSGANSLAFDWGPANNKKAASKSKYGDGWLKGEKCSPFYGAVIVLNYSHVAFIVGRNSKKNNYVYIGGNQGSKKMGHQKISYGTVTIGQEYSIMKPKGYKVPNQHKVLKEMTINADGSYSSSR